jgi:hypothetical protein
MTAEQLFSILNLMTVAAWRAGVPAPFVAHVGCCLGDRVDNLLNHRLDALPRRWGGARADSRPWRA